MAAMRLWDLPMEVWSGLASMCTVVRALDRSKPMTLESTIDSATYRSAALSVPSRLQAASFKRADAAYMLIWLV